MIEKIVERINSLKMDLERSACQHNALLGALQEAQNMYQLCMSVTSDETCGEKCEGQQEEIAG